MTQSFSFLIVIYEATKQFLSVRYVSSIIFFGNHDQLYQTWIYLHIIASQYDM